MSYLNSSQVHAASNPALSTRPFHIVQCSLSQQSAAFQLQPPPLCLAAGETEMETSSEPGRCDA